MTSIIRTLMIPGAGRVRTLRPDVFAKCLEAAKAAGRKEKQMEQVTAYRTSGGKFCATAREAWHREVTESVRLATQSYIATPINAVDENGNVLIFHDPAKALAAAEQLVADLKAIEPFREP